MSKRELIRAMLPLIVFPLVFVANHIYWNTGLDNEIRPYQYRQVWEYMHSGIWNETKEAIKDGKITHREFAQLRKLANERAKESLMIWANEPIPEGCDE